MKIFTIIFSLVMGSLLYADESPWTDKERMGNRKAVLSGTVKKIEKVKDQKTPKVHLMRATVAVEKIDKGAELIRKAKTVLIYYKTSPLGAGYRCPPFPVLKEENSGRFYLRHDTSLTDEASFVLEMGSDFQINLEAEQNGADQPATVSESKPEGEKKSKPKSEGCSQ